MTHLPEIDILRIDETWSEEQRQILKPVRRFIDEEVLPCIADHHQHETFPESLMPSLKALGILEAVADESIDPITYGLVNREIERGSSTLRSILSVQGSLVLGAILQFGSGDQKKRWVQPLGRMEAWGCFGLTEPDYGSNPAGMQTRAERVSGGFKITGAKCWITNGARADVAVIWARLDDKIQGFLVETDRPRFSANIMKGKWSFRSSETAQLYLDGVDVPEDALLPGATSLGAALKCLARARYTITWGVCGAAQACLEETLAYLKERTQFGGQPLASHQLIQYKLAWMAAELSGMTLIARRLGEIKETGDPEPAQIALGKMHNCRKAIEIARACRELLGANGIHDEYHIGRRMVDLETVLTYEGTENIHALTIGAAMTGIKAFG